jgi:hypothetical protein
MSPIYQWVCKDCGHSLERMVFGLHTAIPETRRCASLLDGDCPENAVICEGVMHRIVKTDEIKQITKEDNYA